MRSSDNREHWRNCNTERLGTNPPRLGGVLFIDLRDRSGIMQIVFNPDFSGEALAVADKVRANSWWPYPVKS